MKKSIISKLLDPNLLVKDIISEASDLIPGGLAKGKTLEDLSKKYDKPISFIKTQLDKGIKVELEHTTSKKIASEIAMDHLWEDIMYYDKLQSIEEVKVSDYRNEVQKAVDLIINKDHDYEYRIRPPYPYDASGFYTPLEDENGNDFYINGKIKYKDGGEIKEKNTKIYIGLANMNAGGTALIGKEPNSDTPSGKAVIIINKNLEDYPDQLFNTINHELTHTLDPAITTSIKPQSTKNAIKSTNPDYKKYWQSSIEISARINELYELLNSKIIKLFDGLKDDDELDKDTYNYLMRIILEYIIFELNTPKYSGINSIDKFISKKDIKGKEGINSLLEKVYNEVLDPWMEQHHDYLISFNPKYPKNIIKGLLSKVNVKGLVSENEDESNTLETYINQINDYAINNGYDIEPFPSINFIDNDEENANNILGTTAYYDPKSCGITLYTLNRHPKDILRSYTHELIHHIQNKENRLNNISTTDINEDEYLKDIEREAYEKGNMLFRGWENSIKSNNE